VDIIERLPSLNRIGKVIPPKTLRTEETSVENRFYEGPCGLVGPNDSLSSPGDRRDHAANSLSPVQYGPRRSSARVTLFCAFFTSHRCVSVASGSTRADLTTERVGRKWMLTPTQKDSECPLN
jgi:hypothetical protein